MTASTDQPAGPIIVYRLDPAEVIAVFRTHFGGAPRFWRHEDTWLAFRTAKVPHAPLALWVQGCYAEDASGLTRVIGLEDETDLQDYLARLRLLNPAALDDRIAEIAAALRPHLPGEKAN